jgi:hypothetical protein
LIFTDRALLPTTDAARSRYEKHRNGPGDPGYVRFLNRAVERTLPHLASGMRGLDYGCGPAPTLGLLMEREGMPCANYDPIFRPDPPAGPFDFLIATEVVEHVSHPAADWRHMQDLLKPGGVLTVMTEFWTSLDAFPTWAYANDFTHVAFHHPRTIDWICGAMGFRALNWEDPRVVVLRKEADCAHRTGAGNQGRNDPVGPHVRTPCGEDSGRPFRKGMR